MTFTGRRASKFNAVPTEYNGRRFDSKAEAAHARNLDIARSNGKVRWVLYQVPVMIGEPGVDKPYRVDFVVCEADGSVHAEEVKGAETAMFRRQKKQWALRGPFPLHVIKGRKVEVIQGLTS